MEFDPNDIKNLVINLKQEQFYGSVELTFIGGTITVYRKIETIKPTFDAGPIKIIDPST